MVVGRIFRAIGPGIAMVAAAGLSGCGDMNARFGSGDGKPLANLDKTGDAPDGVALGGPDMVVITTGDTFEIEMAGSDAAKDRMRFDLRDGTLAIGRENGFSRDGDYATVSVTMPAPSSILIGGSGRITSDAVANDAELAVAGAGEIVALNVDADTLDVRIGGSGRVRASGRTRSLNLTIGGSGTADLAVLQVDDADVNIGGSGNASFASDGTVDATIAGSGNVRVRGSASCTISTSGSGSLICEDSADPDEDAA